MYFSLCISTMDRFDNYLRWYLPRFLTIKYIDEIIVSDEDGRDAEKIKNAFPNSIIKTVIHEGENGPFLNKLNACKHAKNEWIILMDSDNCANEIYFKSAYEYIQTNDLGKATILAPDNADPHYDFRHFDNMVYKRGLLKVFEEHEKQEMGERAPLRVLMNTGNYVLNKYLVDNLNIENERDKLCMSSACDVTYMNILFMEQMDAEFHIVPKMEYEHSVHANSTYLNTYEKYPEFIQSINKRFEDLETKNLEI